MIKVFGCQQIHGERDGGSVWLSTDMGQRDDGSVWGCQQIWDKEMMEVFGVVKGYGTKR